jgi:hypothetical protein
MKTYAFLITTILSTGLTFASPSFAEENIATRTVTEASKPVSAAEITDPRVAASNFVRHVNFARVALAMKNTDLAKKHILQARQLAALIKGETEEKYRVTELRSGRVVYEYDTEYKYHYFPIQTGPVQVKELSNGSPWAKNNLAVTDADIVYLTLDLRDYKDSTYFDKADAAIIEGNLKEADNQLAMLIDASVKVDARIAVPNDKARDNLALARNFIAGKNYDGARYALTHADNALDELQRNDLYKEHRNDIIAMRKDVSNLQGYITENDPTMIEKTDKKLDKWWNDLENWSQAKK